MAIRLAVVALIVSMVCNAVLAYHWIDRSITLAYATDSFDMSHAMKRHLESLLAAEWMGMPEAAVQEKLRAEAARRPEEDILVKKEDGALWMDQIPFKFEGGRLTGIGQPKPDPDSCPDC